MFFFFHSNIHFQAVIKCSGSSDDCSANTYTVETDVWLVHMKIIICQDTIQLRIFAIDLLVLNLYWNQLQFLVFLSSCSVFRGSLGLLAALRPA